MSKAFLSMYHSISNLPITLDIASDKAIFECKSNFSYFSMKTYVVGTH